MNIFLLPHPSFQPGVLGEGVGAAVEVGGKRQLGRQSGLALDPFGRPVATGSLQYPGLVGIGDDETVVITERGVPKPARPALTVSLKQGGDHVQGILRRSAPFEAQAYQVHTNETGFGFMVTGENRLAANNHPLIVGPHLTAPAPPRLAEHNAAASGHLGDGQVGALKQGVGVVFHGR